MLSKAPVENYIATASLPKICFVAKRKTNVTTTLYWMLDAIQVTEGGFLIPWLPLMRYPKGNKLLLIKNGKENENFRVTLFGQNKDFLMWHVVWMDRLITLDLTLIMNAHNGQLV